MLAIRCGRWFNDTFNCTAARYLFRVSNMMNSVPKMHCKVGGVVGSNSLVAVSATPQVIGRSFVELASDHKFSGFTCHRTRRRRHPIKNSSYLHCKTLFHCLGHKTVLNAIRIRILPTFFRLVRIVVLRTTHTRHPLERGWKIAIFSLFECVTPIVLYAGPRPDILPNQLIIIHKNK